MSIEYTCKDCGKSFTRYNSLNRICSKCQFNKYAKPKKAIKRIGPVAKKWIETRHEWIKKHITDNGLWECFYCGRLLTLDQLTLDHKLSRGRHPEKRFDENNLVPACWGCNEKKGSKDEIR